MKTPTSLIALCVALLAVTRLDLAAGTFTGPPACSPAGLTPASYSSKNAVANSKFGPIPKFVCLPTKIPGLQDSEPVTVTPVAGDCALIFTFSPTTQATKLGKSIQFTESAVAPAGFASDGHVESCKVVFKVTGAWSGNTVPLYTQNFTVTAAAPKGCTAISCCNQYQVNTKCDSSSGQCNLAAINLMDNSQIGAAQCNTKDTSGCTVTVGGVYIPGPDGQPQPTCTNCPCTKKTINLQCTDAKQCNLCEIDQMSGSSIGCFQCNAADAGQCSLNVF